MKNFKTIIKLQFAFVFVSIFLLQSCSDFLEQEPGTQTSITEQLKNKAGVLEALRGMYVEAEGTVRTEAFAVYADLQGGNLKFTPSRNNGSKGEINIAGSVSGIYAFDDQSDASNLAAFYGNCYDVINQANLILEFTDALPDATEAEKNQIKAEALSVRAYMHFLMAEIYSQNYGFTDNASHPGIVYNKTSIYKGLTYPARETAANTYSLLIEDLTNAINLYSDTSLINGPSYSFFNKTNTKALLARVYLAKKDWRNAYDTANDIIANSGINLVTKGDYIAQWEQPDLPVSEILLEFSHPVSDVGLSSGSMSTFYGYTTDASYGNYAASDDLLNLYESTDIRKQLFLEKPLTTIVNLQEVKLNYNFTKKFQDNPGFVVFRLSEQYLIRAEAALGLNNSDQAVSDINTIRARANATLLTDTNNIAEALFLERRKELCFENSLFFDIARNQKDVSRNDGCISTICSLTYPSPKFVLPIPYKNLTLNSNLKQNESY